ncbi:hypothetical protein Esti_001451 [Eimeria stiedai]
MPLVACAVSVAAALQSAAITGPTAAESQVRLPQSQSSGLCSSSSSNNNDNGLPLLRVIGVSVHRAHIGPRVPAAFAGFGAIERLRWSHSAYEGLFRGLPSFHCELYRLNQNLQ